MARERQIPIPLFDAYTAKCVFCRGIIMLISDPWVKCDCCSGIRHLYCAGSYKVSSRGEVKENCNTVCGNHEIKEEIVVEAEDGELEDEIVPKYVCPDCLTPCSLRDCEHEYCERHYIQCATCNNTVCALEKGEERGEGKPDNECSFLCEGGGHHDAHVVCKKCWNKNRESCPECSSKCECCDTVYDPDNSGGYCEGCQHSHCSNCSAYCEACENDMCSCCSDSNRPCDGCEKEICKECRSKCNECNNRNCSDCMHDCEQCGESVCSSDDREGHNLCYVKCHSPRCSKILCNSCQDNCECSSCKSYFCSDHMDSKCDLCKDNTCSSCLNPQYNGDDICNNCVSKDDFKRQLVMDKYPIEGDPEELMLKIEKIDREIEDATVENKHHLHNTRFLLANKLEQELQKIKDTIERNRNDAVLESIKGKPPLDLEDLEDVEPYDVIYGKTLEALLLSTSGSNRLIGVDLKHDDIEPSSEYANLALPAATRGGSIDLLETPDPIGYLEIGATASFECISPFTGNKFTIICKIDLIGTKDKSKSYFPSERSQMIGTVVPVSDFNDPESRNDFFIEIELKVSEPSLYTSFAFGQLQKYFGVSMYIEAQRAGISAPYRYTAEVNDSIVRWDDGLSAKIICTSVVPPGNPSEYRAKALDLENSRWPGYYEYRSAYYDSPPYTFVQPDLEPGVATPDETPEDYRWIDRDIDLDDEPRTNPIGQIPSRYKSMGFTKVGQKKKSNRSGKKWMVLAKKGDQYKVVHGGYEGMQDYTQHRDSDRRKKFWSRMGGKNSSKANDPFSPLYWHKKFGTW